MEKLSFLRPVALRGMIRLGDKSDGGYVVYGPLLNETDALVSYGVGDNISFEEHFSHLTHKNVYMFDPTLFGKYLLDLHIVKKQLCRLQFGYLCRYLLFIYGIWRRKKRLETMNVWFFNEGIATSKRAKYDTLKSHLERLGLTQSNVLLKIDIEEGEYEVFSQRFTYDCLAGVNQLIIEFHNLKQRLRELEAILADLKREFTLVHIHGNNHEPTFTYYDRSGDGRYDFAVPDVLELLCVRTTRLRNADILENNLQYPIPDLDYPNSAERPDHPIECI